MKKFNFFKKDTLCVICAKGNSEGLPKKNLKLIKGKPLVNYAIEKAKKNKLKYICISTESNKVIEIAKKNKIKVFFKRSKKLCRRNVSKLMVWKDAIIKSEKYFMKKFKYILDIEVTNPLINHKDLEKFLKNFYKKKVSYDGQFCITPARKNPYFNLMEYRNKKYVISKKLRNKEITARQNAPKTLEHVAGLYCAKRDYILNCKYLFEGKINGYNVPLLKSFDIDSIEDFELVESLLKKQKKV